MGCGRNGTFDKVPDLKQWAVLAVHESGAFNNKAICGPFLYKWWKFFHCETYTLLLTPVEGRGKWDGKQPFGDLPLKSGYEGPVATLTRATIRLRKLKFFWRHVAPVAAHMDTADGFVMSVGIGEVPWVKQATFSVWQSTAAMKTFAYQMQAHTEVIRKTREQKWYSEDMFVRFRITGHAGTLKGRDPLQGMI